MDNTATICPVTKPLVSVGLFKGLGDHEIHIIRAAAAKRTFEASQIITRAEESAVRFFVIELLPGASGPVTWCARIRASRFEAATVGQFLNGEATTH
jgi:hypothetical protein